MAPGAFGFPSGMHGTVKRMNALHRMFHKGLTRFSGRCAVMIPVKEPCVHIPLDHAEALAESGLGDSNPPIPLWQNPKSYSLLPKSYWTKRDALLHCEQKERRRD